MPKIKEIQRSILIYRKIKNGSYPSVQELLDLLKNRFANETDSIVGYSKRTLIRDFKLLNELMKIEIKFSKQRNGYYIIEHGISWPDECLERLIEAFDLYNALDTVTKIDDIVFLEKRQYRGTEYMPRLINAIKDLCPVHFTYQRYLGTESFDLEIFPYALKECRTRWYLLGTVKNQKELLSFGLDRMSNLKILSGKFKKEADIDIKKKFESLIGIDGREIFPEEEIILKFNTYDGNYIKSLPIHHSQKIIKENPEQNEIHFSLHLKITEDLILALLSRGLSLEVIKPQSLAKRICEIYREGLKRYTS